MNTDFTLKRFDPPRISEDEARRLVLTGKRIIDPLCPPDRWYALPEETAYQILLERCAQGYLIRESEKDIVLYRPQQVNVG